VLDFRLSHVDETAGEFQRQLQDFLLGATRKFGRRNATGISGRLGEMQRKLVRDLRRGEKVTRVNDVMEYFDQQYIEKAFVCASSDGKVIWDSRDVTATVRQISDKRLCTCEQIYHVHVSVDRLDSVCLVLLHSTGLRLKKYRDTKNRDFSEIPEYFAPSFARLFHKSVKSMFHAMLT